MPAAAAHVLPRPDLQPGAGDWLIWVTLLPLGMFVACTGTILPDDGLSGGSLSVITGVLQSVPLIGTYLVSWIFSGPPPGHEIIVRDYWVHVLVLPALHLDLYTVTCGSHARSGTEASAMSTQSFIMGALKRIGAARRTA